MMWADPVLRVLMVLIIGVPLMSVAVVALMWLFMPEVRQEVTAAWNAVWGAVYEDEEKS
jgi:phage shock protein PspC (stress-responsive transcriptional regulator)